MAQARTLVSIQRYEDAASALRQVLASEPDRAEAHCLLAQCLLELPGQTQPALAEAERAIALAPGSEWPHRIRAIALMRLKRSKKAVDAAREAVRLAPNVPNTYIVLSDALRRTRKLKEACQVAERARELAPNSAATHNAVGLVALSARRNADAEAHFRAALALEPENATALNNLGVAALRQGRRNAAIAYFADASRINPRSSLARRNAVGAAGTRAGAVLGVVAIVSAITHSSAITVTAGALVLALVFGSAVLKRAPVDGEPVASKELIRTLRKERPASGTMIRVGWLAAATAIATMVVVALFALLVFLTDVAAGTVNGTEAVVALLIGASSASGAGILIWRQRRA